MRTWQAKKRRAMLERKRQEESFLVPQTGGALQKMTKDKDGNITLKLAKKIKITSDTYIFRFQFPDPDWSFGLPIGNHVVFSATIPTTEKP